MFPQASVILFTGWGGGVADTPHPPPPTRADNLPPRQTQSPGQTPPRVDTPGQTLLPVQTPPPETATAADGTHPPGMHSCLICIRIRNN